MAFNGFALGGAAEGFLASQRNQTNQQQVDQTYELGQRRLQLEQQSQQNAMQRDMLARADKSRSELMGLASTTIEQLKLRGIDNPQIAKAIQPIVQAAKRLATSSGLDASMIDAQVATALAQPKFDVNTALGPPVQAAPPSPAQPSIGSQPALQPSMNLTGPGTTITGIDYGPVQNLDRSGNVVGTSPAPQVAENTRTPTPAPAATPTPQDQAQQEVDRFTHGLLNLPPNAPASMREAMKSRLDDALKRRAKADDIEVKTVKDENQNEHIVFVDKKNRTVTDQNGNPYVPPTGGDSDAGAIAEAIKEGRQPPVLTGLYKNAKAVRAQLARSDFDLTRAQME